MSEIYYMGGDRVEVESWGPGTVIRDDGILNDFDVSAVDRVWVRLDCGDNPVACLHSELQAV